jgi:DNA invertase Pin-like site-specific DNA recombinase
LATRGCLPAIKTSIYRKTRWFAQNVSIFEDTASGKNASARAKACYSPFRPGDSLVVWKLDRLGRSVRDLITLVSELQDKGIHFRSLTDSIDTSTPAWPLILQRHERPGGNGEANIKRTRAG